MDRACNQRKRVFESISPDFLPPERHMKMSRKAREYKVVYSAEDGGAAVFSHASIETQRHAAKLRRTHTSHRSIDNSVVSTC